MAAPFFPYHPPDTHPAFLRPEPSENPIKRGRNMRPGADILQARILIADRPAADARLAESMLRDAGYVHVATMSPRDATACLAAEHRFDLLILGAGSPAMNGCEVISKVAGESPRRPPILAIIADPDDIELALKSGARDCVSAPLRRTELLARVRNLLEMGLAEKGLRQARSRLRALVEQSIAGIYIVQQGIWTYVNPRFCEILGYSAEELIGHASVQFLHEDEVARLLENRARALAGDRKALSATYRFLRKDGDVVHVSLESSMTQEHGRWTLLGIAQDVTARINGERLLREAEAHYRALVEQSLVGIYIMENGRIFYANQMLRELLGFSLVEISRLTPQQLVDEQDHGIIEPIEARRRAGETGTITAECRVRGKDGGVRHVEIETKVIDLAGHRAVLGVVQDVSESHDARVELESANRRLQYLSDRVLGVQEEERRVLSGELHDDVGQSLLALQIGLHRLAQDSVQGKPRLLEECVDIVSAMQDKIRQVSLRLHPPQLTQLGLTDALRALVSRQRATTGLDIRCTLEGPAKGELSDAAEIACYRICQEALNNATRHAQAGVIEVRTTRQRERLCLSIHDDGSGFDADERREAVNASGNLGLISMEERARLAGGELELRTAPGAGTVVIAMFPLDIRRAAAAAAGA